MSRRLALPIGLLLLAASPAATAYVRSTTTNTNAPLAWKHSNCVYVRVNSNGSADIDNGSDIAAAKRSIDNWRTRIGACSYLKFVVQEDSADAKPEFTKSGVNENVIFWVEKGWPHERMAAAITTVFFLEKAGSEQDGRILDADIEMNGEFFRFSVGGGNHTTDVENTVTHELGHVMGLDHPCDDKTRTPVPKDNLGQTIPDCSTVLASNDPKYVAMRDVTMWNFADPGETKKRTPEADDIQGICEIYPTKDDPGDCFPVDYNAGDDGCRVAPGSGLSKGALFWILLLLVPLLRRR